MAEKTKQEKQHFNQIIAFMIFAIVIAVLFFITISPYLGVIFIAFIASAMFEPLYKGLDKKGWFNSKVNTGIITVVFALLIIVPFTIMISQIVKQSQYIIEWIQSGESSTFFDSLTEYISGFFPGHKERIDEIFQNLFTIFTEFIESILLDLAKSITSVVSSVVSLITNTIIFIVIFVAILPNWNKMMDLLVKYIPFEKKVTKLLLDKTTVATKSLILASLATAVLSGISVWICFAIVGLPLASFFAMLAMFLSVIPFVGTSLVMIPAGIVLALTGNWGGAIFFFVAQGVVIGNIDLALRPIFVDDSVDVNPLVIILSVMGGLAMFGATGVIYGPLIAILFVTCLEVYNYYFADTKIDFKTKKATKRRIPAFIPFIGDKGDAS